MFHSLFGTRTHRVSFAPSCLVRRVVFHSRFSLRGRRVSFALGSFFCGIDVTFSWLTAQGCPVASCFIRASRLSAKRKPYNLLGFFNFPSCFIRAPAQGSVVFHSRSTRSGKNSPGHEHFPQPVEGACFIRAILVSHSRRVVFDSQIVVFHSQADSAIYSFNETYTAFWGA